MIRKDILFAFQLSIMMIGFVALMSCQRQEFCFDRPPRPAEPIDFAEFNSVASIQYHYHYTFGSDSRNILPESGVIFEEDSTVTDVELKAYGYLDGQSPRFYLCVDSIYDDSSRLQVVHPYNDPFTYAALLVPLSFSRQDTAVLNHLYQYRGRMPVYIKGRVRHYIVPDAAEYGYRCVHNYVGLWIDRAEDIDTINNLKQ